MDFYFLNIKISTDKFVISFDTTKDMMNRSINSLRVVEVYSPN